MSPETFRFVFYLYGRLNLVRASALRMFKQDKTNLHKRTTDPDQLETTRSIMIPLQYDIDNPNSINTHYCDVMMVEDSASMPTFFRLRINLVWQSWTRVVRELCMGQLGQTLSRRRCLTLDFPLSSSPRFRSSVVLVEKQFQGKSRFSQLASEASMENFTRLRLLVTPLCFSRGHLWKPSER